MCGGREWCCVFFQAPELLQRGLVQSYLSASIRDSYRVMLPFFFSFLLVLQAVWTLGRWLPKVCVIHRLATVGYSHCCCSLMSMLSSQCSWISQTSPTCAVFFYQFFMHALPLFSVITWRYLCIKLLNEWRDFLPSYIFMLQIWRIQ
jgi:hypothetical protein